MVCQELQEFQDLRGLHRRYIRGMVEVREEEGTSVCLISRFSESLSDCRGSLYCEFFKETDYFG